MTDLEDLWESLPTGQAPTSRILHLGRRAAAAQAAPRRRPMRWVGTVAAVGGAFAAGTLVANPPSGGPGGGDPSRAIAQPSLIAFGADLAPAESCDDLLATYVDRGLGLVTAEGWGGVPYYYGAFSRSSLQRGPAMWNDLPVLGIPTASALSPVSGTNQRLYKSPDLSRVGASDTGTNVQEAGVDEPDSAKTDGGLLVRLRDDELITYDVSGDQVEQLSSLTLTGIEEGQILLAGDTVIAVGADARSTRSDWNGLRRGSRVQTIDISDPESPKVTDDVTFDAAVSTVRQHGDTVRMVLSTGLPELDFVSPGDKLTQQESLKQNRKIIEDSKLEDWLPTYDAGDGTADLLDCKNVAVPSAKVGLDTAAVVTFGTDEPTKPSAFGLAGATTVAYESADRLYLASTGDGWACRCISTTRGGMGGTGTSYLFEFELSDGGAKHVASGEVEGTIRDRWSMDESDGVLRVLVGPSSETANANSVVTLERQGDDLVETGRLDGLGPNEQVQSVRWQDDVAIIVTFRQVDPLYVVDLRDEPALLSELKIPGFSSYLHPLGTDRLIGVGEGRPPGSRRWGAQMGLFDVTDLADVKQLDVWHYRSGSRPVAGTDPRAFTWVADDRTVLTVIQRGRTGSLSIQRLVEGRLENRMVAVEYGDDIYSVRTLEMPDGRIVLVTGEDVEFLDLG